MTSDPTIGWTLDPRLQQDTEEVGNLPLSRVLLIDDASFPWILLVPRRAGASEIIDLAPPDQVQLLNEIRQASEVMKTITVCDKLNVAALGNVVAQLHVHIIARTTSDAAWPKPVWGSVPARRYDQATLRQFLGLLRAQLPLIQGA